MGSEENQFTPLGAGVKKLIFRQFINLYLSFPIVIKDFFATLWQYTSIKII
jgi:hypothetical protein